MLRYKCLMGGKRVGHVIEHRTGTDVPMMFSKAEK